MKQAQQPQRPEWPPRKLVLAIAGKPAVVVAALHELAVREARVA